MVLVLYGSVLLGFESMMVAVVLVEKGGVVIISSIKNVVSLFFSLFLFSHRRAT